MERPARYKISRISFVYNYLLALLASAFLILLFLSVRLDSFIWKAVVYVTILIALMMVLEPEFLIVYKYYAIEDIQLSMVEGILTRKRLSIPYNKIVDVSVSRTFLGRILNFGDVKISGIRNDIVMRGMKNPYKIYGQIQEKIASSGRWAKKK